MTVIYTPSATVHANALEFDDGDAPSAANLNPLAEAAFDTAAAAVANHTAMVGGKWIVDHEIFSLSAGSKGTTTSATFGVSGDVELFSATMTCATGDIVEVTVGFHCACATADSTVEYQLAYQAGGGSITAITGAIVRFGTKDASVFPVHLSGAVAWPSATSVKILLQQRVVSGGGTSDIQGPVSGFATQLRTIA